MQTRESPPERSQKPGPTCRYLPLRSIKEIRLAEQHSKQYLRLIIQILYKKKTNLEENGQRTPLTAADSSSLRTVRMELAQTKARKLTKLRVSMSPCEDMQPIEGFKNLSSHAFSQEEKEILSKGPSYAPPQRLNKHTVMQAEARVECLMDKLSSTVSSETKSEFSGAVKRILREATENSSSKKIARTIKGIKDQEMIFTRSDKSKRLIALDQDTYGKLLQEHTKHQREARILLPSSVQAKFNAQLNTVARKYGEPLRTTLGQQICSEPLPSILRALPKDHKDGPIKTRPIVAAVDAPATKLSKFLANTFSPLLPCVEAHIPSTSDFLSIIDSTDASSDYSFASLDVVDLYGSIPIEDNTFPGVITIVANFFDHHKAGTILRDLRREDFCTLLRLCLTSDTIFSDNKVFKQTTGIQMGNNFSCVCAIIFMNYIENEIRDNLGPKIKLWKRFIDDVFVLYKEMPPQELLSICNDVHPNIVFTIEQPVNGTLPFLDVLLSHHEDRFSYRLYVKPSHSGAVIPWDSHHPRSMIINILKNEMRRATRNGSGPLQIEEGRNIISKRYKANGYPEHAIKRAIFEVDNPLPPRPKPKKFLSLPFVGEKRAGEIKRILRKCGLSDILSVTFKSRTLSSIFRPHSPFLCFSRNCKYCSNSRNGDDCNQKFIVYFIECRQCSATYRMSERLNEL